MIKFENTVTPSGEQWRSLILGARNAMNSWEKSDSSYHNDPVYDEDHPLFIHDNPVFSVGPNDLSLMMKLRNAGTDHRKFMRMITVYVDITAPLYWWKEFDTYKVGTVANSCSTMHCIHKKEFTLDDFSHEHVLRDNSVTVNYVENDFRILNNLQWLMLTIDLLNSMREAYLKTKDKVFWWQMIQLLPTSYNQKRTVMLNYEVLANIYKSRKDHKLDEWHNFCDWIKGLPYSELIMGKPKRKRDTFADALEDYMENHKPRPTPSLEEIEELFEKAKEVDGRIVSHSVYDKLGMKVLDFYDANHKTLYAADLYCTTLNDILVFIKVEVEKLTRQNLELGA